MFTWPHKVPPDLERDTVLRVDLELGLGFGLVLSASSAGIMPTELGCVRL